MAHKKRGQWGFRLTLASLVSIAGGVVTAPRHLQNLRRRMVFEIAAGPLASLLTAAVAMVVLLSMPGSHWVAWWKVPAVIAAMAAAATVVNLIPFGFAAVYSDGALLVQLLFGGPFADMRAALKMIAATTVSAMRPRDIDPVALSNGLRAASGLPQAATFRAMEMICAVDRDDMEAARTHLNSVLERMPTPEKSPDPGSAAEFAFYLAYLDGDAGRAGRWLRDVEEMAAKKKVSLASDHDYWLSLASVRIAEGRNEEAEAACKRVEELSRNDPTAGLYEYERDMLAKLRERRWLRPPTEIAGDNASFSASAGSTA